jgi:hypothetical protein
VSRVGQSVASTVARPDQTAPNGRSTHGCDVDGGSTVCSHAASLPAAGVLPDPGHVGHPQ